MEKEVLYKGQELLHSKLINRDKTQFLKAVIKYSALLHIEPNWLMQVMYRETGGTFSPNIPNQAHSGARGLIQFMPSTVTSLGLTMDKLCSMTNYEQMEIVYKYLKPYANRMHNFGDVYLAVFYPAAMGREDNYKLPAYTYRQNAGLDLNKDGVITRGEIIKWASIGLK